MSKKKDISITRSSAAEYLTLIATSGSGGVQAIYADESIWLTQKMTGCWKRKPVLSAHCCDVSI